MSKIKVWVRLVPRWLSGRICPGLSLRAQWLLVVLAFLTV